MTSAADRGGPCRQLLDWLVTQHEILDQHVASRIGSSPEQDALTARQLHEARDWLNAQLERALRDRGIDVAT